MKYSEFLPSERLRDFIKCYWILDSDVDSVKLASKMIPFGCIDIIFQQFARVYYCVNEAHQRILLPQHFITPQSQRTFDLELEGKIRIYGVRLHPHASRSVLNLPIPKLNNTILPVETILGSRYREFGTHISQLKSIDEKIRALNTFFENEMEAFQAIDPVVTDICQHLVEIGITASASGKRKKVPQLSSATQIRFLNQVGLTPQYFRRLVQLHFALSIYWNFDNVSNYSELATRAGFANETIFMRDFRLIFRMSPPDFFRSSFTVAKFYLNARHHSFLLNSYRNKRKMLTDVYVS